jgi:aminoglycoside phosphotransferase family enzyme/predicted kinase
MAHPRRHAQREPESHGLPAELARPGAFPPPAPRRVTLAATHASWVFLTEGEAWKVKRPVSFGFLDYSDADKRRHCCEEELRLGLRLAPDVYLGVVPVYLGPNGHSFVAPGTVVDHAVRMRRLPDSESAAALLLADRLSPRHLQRLADLLAEFFASAPATPQLGVPGILAANLAENQRQLRPYVDRIVDGDEVNALYHWQQGQLFANAGRLRERIDLGRIRDGHGDLRLEHVYFPEDAAPLVIDPIEFNRRFRCADVALDVAFLAMELDAGGRHDLAAFFLSSFARASNDYELYPLMDLYLAYRAQVRAKVACFVAGDPTTPPAKARRKAASARRLMALALRYRHNDQPRPIIAVGGPIGAGKSALAEALSRTLALPAISSDATRKHLGGVRATEPGGATLYSPEMDRRTLAEMLRRARLVVDSGRGVVLDATFRQRETRAAARALAEANGAPFLFVELVADAATLRARLRARKAGESVSDAREDLLERMLAEYDPPTELPEGQRLRLDGRLEIDALAGCVARALER